MADTVTELPAAQHRTGRLALICSPWHTARFPSLQCGLLSAQVADRGHKVDVIYLNLEFAATMPVTLYEKIANSGFGAQSLLGEWIFSYAAFGAVSSPTAYLDENPELADAIANTSVTFDELCQLRTHAVPRWIQEAVGRRHWTDYDLVGFSSTFEQNCASIALAKEIKKRTPSVPCVFGGANVLPPMGQEILRAVDAVDYIVCGEGEAALPKLLESVIAGEGKPAIPGVHTAGGEMAGAADQAEQVRDLDSLVAPDYRDYYSTIAELRRQNPELTAGNSLFLETSRGCWWGEKHHCTFCGLPDFAMKYRSKSPERVMRELAELSSRYQVLSYVVVDSILDMRHIEDLLGTKLSPRNPSISTSSMRSR